MAAVKERAAELESMRQRFANRVAGHIEALLETEVRPCGPL